MRNSPTPHFAEEWGVGYTLLMRFYLGDASWWTFTEPEQAILRKASRRFAQELQAAGFLPDREHGGDDDRGL